MPWCYVISVMVLNFDGTHVIFLRVIASSIECAGFTFLTARAVITPRMVTVMVAEPW